MNLRESYYVSSNSHYNISYIHLSPQNPLFDSKIPTNPFAKAIGLFLELLQRPYPHQRKAKEHYPQRPTQIESKVFSTAFCLKSFVWYHSHFKAFTPVTPPKTPQKKNFAPCHQDEASQVGHSNIGAFPGTQHHCLVVPLQTRPWQTGPWRIRQEARANEMSQLRAASRDGTGTSDSPIV